jgi:tetratricopeptide (TPR) repeat protein
MGRFSIVVDPPARVSSLPRSPDPAAGPVRARRAAASLLPLIALALSACAQLPARAPAPPAPAASETQAQPIAHTAEPPARVEPLPNQELTPQIVYQLLLAEIAGQRGDLGLSASAYLDLARKTRDPRVARRAAEIAHFSRQNEVALEAVRLWLEIDPQSSQARYMLIGMLAQTNRFAELDPQIARILEQEKDNLPEALARIGRVLNRHPDKIGARGAIDRMTAPYLQVPEARILRAQAAAAANDPQQALAEADAALALRPDWEQALLFKVQTLQRDSPAKALDAMRQFLQAYPKAREVRLQYARSLVGEKRYQDARGEFQKLLADFPDNHEVAFAVAALSFQLQDYEAADRQFRKLIDSGYGDHATVRLYLGQIAENQKRYDDAIGWYGSIPPGEQYLPAQVRQANVLRQQGKVEEARAHLQQASAANGGERVQLTLAEAQLLRDAGRPQDAFEVLDRGLAAQPNQPDLLYEAALAAEKIGRGDLLEVKLRKLIEIKPDHAHAYNALGYSLADRNERLAEAHELIVKALQLAPDDPFIMDSMGWVLFRQGKFEEALDYLSRAYKLRPDPEIAAHLGEVLWTLGRRDEATRTWRDAAKVNPGNEVLSAVIKKFIP